MHTGFNYNFRSFILHSPFERNNKRTLNLDKNLILEFEEKNKSKRSTENKRKYRKNELV